MAYVPSAGLALSGTFEPNLLCAFIDSPIGQTLEQFSLEATNQ